MSRYIDVEPMRDDWLHEVNESIFCPNDFLDSIDNRQIRHVQINGKQYADMTDYYNETGGMGW